MTVGSLKAVGAGVAVQNRWLIRNVDIEAQAGEVIALVGPNGAGKSTLLKALSGELELAEGEVLIDDRPIGSFRPKELATRRAVLPQQTLIEFAFTAREIVEMGRTAQRSAGDHDAVVTRAMAQTDVLRFERRIFPSLSGGEQARVSISRVLAQETPILLLDEPTASLDLRHQETIMTVAHNVARAGGIVVMIAHDLNLAAAYADRIALIASGSVIAIGTPWNTLTEPLLRAVFDCDVAVAKHPLRNCPLVLPVPAAASRQPQEARTHGLPFGQ
jgi:iron complex transport system ATP-binding protein